MKWWKFNKKWNQYQGYIPSKQVIFSVINVVFISVYRLLFSNSQFPFPVSNLLMFFRSLCIIIIVNLLNKYSFIQLWILHHFLPFCHNLMWINFSMTNYRRWFLFEHSVHYPESLSWKCPGHVLKSQEQNQMTSHIRQ